MRVVGVQHDIVFEDAKATLDSVTPLLDAAARFADLVVLPEMFSTGFTMRPERVAEPHEGRSASFLADAAARHGCWVAGSVPTDPDDGGLPVNRLHVISPDGTRHHYDKLHPFSFGGEHEKYRAGTATLVTNVGGLRCAWFVCYDLRFAPVFWDLARDCDAYVVVANWPAARRSHWDRLLQARAIENQAYVVGVNRVGLAGRIGHDGGTAIIGPTGERLAVADDSVEAYVGAEISHTDVAAVRQRYPFLDDRRG